VGEQKKTTARRPRATTRTKKLLVEEAPPVIAEAPAPATIVEPPPPPPPPPLGEWVPIVYEGAAVFSDADAGVFVAGTRTRLKARVAARLLRVEGFRLAA
jgi:hypothetical protein